ncbi:MAG: hypothetical protein ACTIIB_10340, partial [Ancrocorticia populi]
SLGFGEGDGWLPQPDWFAIYSVETQEGAADSYLNLYRRALALRRELQSAEELTWHDSPENTLHFSRPGGWHCFTNFGKENVPLPAGQVIIGAQSEIDGELPGEATVWLRL